MELRAAFRIPFDCTTPVELVKHGAVLYPSMCRKEDLLISLIEIFSC